MQHYLWYVRHQPHQLPFWARNEISNAKMDRSSSYQPGIQCRDLSQVLVERSAEVIAAEAQCNATSKLSA